MKLSIPDSWLQPGDLPAALRHLQQCESAIMVCYGDSITYGLDCETGRQTPQPYPQRLTAHLTQAVPSLHLRTVNAGQSGWTAADGAQALDYLVLSRHPDLTLLMFGLNDAYQDLPLPLFRQHLQDMVQRLQAQASLVLLMPPTPVAYMPGVEVPDYVAATRTVASQTGSGFFDLFAAVEATVEQQKVAVDDLLPDGVHFSPAGYSLLGDWIFAAWQRLVAR